MTLEAILMLKTMPRSVVHMDVKLIFTSQLCQSCRRGIGARRR